MLVSHQPHFFMFPTFPSFLPYLLGSSPITFPCPFSSSAGSFARFHAHHVHEAAAALCLSKTRTTCPVAKSAFPWQLCACLPQPTTSSSSSLLLWLRREGQHTLIRTWEGPGKRCWYSVPVCTITPSLLLILCITMQKNGFNCSESVVLHEAFGHKAKY